MTSTPSRIHIGIGGWTFPPWRDNFYPAGLPHAKELAYAAERLTAIEINATYYRLQSAASFAKWRDNTPERFVFAVKGSRYVTNRRVLAEAGESLQRFMSSGLIELGDKLGPIVWQFATTKVFDAADFGAFLRLLPRELGGRALRHAVEVRHPSFVCEAFVELARAHRVACVFADSDDHPSFADLSADFVYARLMKTLADEPTGYPAERIAFWSDAATRWATGGDLAELPHAAAATAAMKPRDVYVFFISGAKERAPGAAMATLAALGGYATRV